MSHRKRKVRENMLFLLILFLKRVGKRAIGPCRFMGVCQIFKLMAKNLAKPIKQTVLLNLYSTIIFAEKKTMDCPRCGSINHRKDGIVGGRQRHYCKDCHYRYTVQQKSNTKSAATRRLALEMYLEGLGFRAIGRILKISHTIVYYWVKEWGERVALPQKEGPVSVVELDEMHTYIGSKKTTVGYGLLLIDLENDLSLLSVGTEAQIQG